MARAKESSRAADGLLDPLTNGLCQQYDNLLSVIDWAGNTLAKAIERLASGETRPRRRSRACPRTGRGLFQAPSGAAKALAPRLRRRRHPPSHGVFEALDRLDNLYTRIVGTMQEVRWALLISEGLRDKAESPEGRYFTSSAEWLAALREE